MFRSNVLLATLVAALTVAGTGVVLADNNEEDMDEQHELTALANAKTSLSQAIAAAEQETGGKAVETGVEHQEGPLAYEVEIAKGNTFQKVLVDLDSGKVIKVTPGEADHEDSDEHDEDDENESD
jgi:uncharacterized membrane protein YkoI